MVKKRGMKFTNRAIELREKFSSRMIVRTAVIFAVSMILFYATSVQPLKALLGFVSVISASIIILFAIILLIFFFLERMNKNTKSKRKPTKKKLVRKKVIKKKTVKKKVTSKKKK